MEVLGFHFPLITLHLVTIDIEGGVVNMHGRLTGSVPPRWQFNVT
jgi:hypothetical protein